MKITAIRTGLLSIPLRKPFKTALRTLERQSSIVVAIDTDAGKVGWGEAPPTGAVTGESLGSIRGAIHEFIAPRLIGQEVENLEVTLDTLDRAVLKNTSAKAAVDMAIYDLFGKRFGVPVYRLLGGARTKTETDLTISVNSPDEMVADAREAVGRGFRILKIKVGREPATDIERLRKIREAVGAGVVIRVDANQGWNAREAVRIMRTLEAAHLGIELVEQPLPAHDVEGMKHVRDAIETPVLADESVFSPLDAAKIIAMKAADYLNIKLMKTGGLRGALRICALAETNNIECFMGCMIESKLSVTAAAHLACARNIITRTDLDSPSLCAEDPVQGGAVLEGPWLQMTDAPGLGITGVDGIAWD